jgi:cytoskeletal protein RodZ
MIRVGQKLYNARIHKSLSLDEVASQIKIRPSFLAAIEKGEYEKLPSPAYAQGFVRNYASYLGLSQQEVLALYRREFDEKRQYKVLPDSLNKNYARAFSGLSISRSFVFLAAIILFLFGYLSFQYRAMFLSPALTLDSPKQDSMVKDEVVVSGKADSNATVFVNDDAVSLNANGEFTKRLTLFSGKNSITIIAKNRFGKETIVQRDVTVKNSGG